MNRKNDAATEKFQREKLKEASRVNLPSCDVKKHAEHNRPNDERFDFSKMTFQELYDELFAFD